MKMGKQVIIADDMRSARLTLESLINRAVPGCVVETVATGEELVSKVALQRLTPTGFYSLIITDNNMRENGMTGLEAIRAIRTFDRRTPIYMFSSDNLEREAREAGATGSMSSVLQITGIAKRYLV